MMPRWSPSPLSRLHCSIPSPLSPFCCDPVTLA
jgi:hypothetical protein